MPVRMLVRIVMLVFATIVDSLAVEFMSVEVLLGLCGFVLERVVPCYHAVEKSLMM